VTGRKAWLSCTGRGHNKTWVGQWLPRLPCLRLRGVSGGYARGMKSSESIRATRGHGGFLPQTDAEPRKYGHRSVFDTLVVRTVNDGCLAGAVGLGHRVRGTPRLGSSRKARDLMRLAGAWMNGGVCGLIRQYTGHLTSRRCGPALVLTCYRGRAVLRRCMAVVSSCRETWH